MWPDENGWEKAVATKPPMYMYSKLLINDTCAKLLIFWSCMQLLHIMVLSSDSYVRKINFILWHVPLYTLKASLIQNKLRNHAIVVLHSSCLNLCIL